MSRELVRVVAAVNSGKIRRELHNNRDHIVISSYTLPDNVVMNGGLYPHDEIEKAYPTLEGTLAPVGHPELNGQFISARSPEAINAHHVGAWNRNVKRVGNRIHLEKWIDVNFAAGTEQGRALLEAIEQGEPIHTSTGIFLEREPVANGNGYSWVARNMEFDHDAILIGQIGAATPEQGVGMMVNVADARPLTPNANGDSMLPGSMRARESALESAARAKFVSDPDKQYVWVQDFDESTVVIGQNDGTSRAYAYSVGENGAVMIQDGGQSVRRHESWVANLLSKLFGNAVESGPQPVNNPPSEGSEMDAKELADALAAHGDKMTANTQAAFAPLVESLTKIAEGQAQILEALTANQREAEKGKRAVVAEKFGESVANSLTGQALEDMYAQCKPKGKPAADLSGNSSDDDGDRDNFALPE